MEERAKEVFKWILLNINGYQSECTYYGVWGYNKKSKQIEYLD